MHGIAAFWALANPWIKLVISAIAGSLITQIWAGRGSRRERVAELAAQRRARVDAQIQTSLETVRRFEITGPRDPDRVVDLEVLRTTAQALFYELNALGDQHNAGVAQALWGQMQNVAGAGLVWLVSGEADRFHETSRLLARWARTRRPPTPVMPPDPPALGASGG